VAIGTSEAERSVLQSDMPDGNCPKGGQGRKGNHRTSLAKLRAKEVEPVGHCEFGANIATGGETEGLRQVGSRIAAWHHRNRVGLAFGAVES